MLPPFARRALAPIALAVCLLGSSLAAQGTPSLTLFNGEGLDGAAVTVRSEAFVTLASPSHSWATS